jgi:hypothetical protein
VHEFNTDYRALRRYEGFERQREPVLLSTTYVTAYGDTL